MENTLDLLEALEHIDPAGLSYQDWVAVGMGLKEAGYPASFRPMPTPSHSL